MTAREMLSRRVRRIKLLIFSCLASLLASISIMLLLIAVLPRGDPGRLGWPIWLGVGGIVISAAVLQIGGIYATSSFRCPWCRESMSQLMWSINSGHANFCPSCGRTLDEELPAKGKVETDDLA